MSECLSGRMRLVPRLTTPPQMPPEVVRLIDAIGNHTRTEILRLLSQQPMTAVDLAAALEVAHSSVNRSLAKLETAGLVTADTPPGRRRGRVQNTWSTVPAQVQTLGQAWVEYALGQTREN